MKKNNKGKAKSKTNANTVLTAVKSGVNKLRCKLTIAELRIKVVKRKQKYYIKLLHQCDKYGYGNAKRYSEQLEYWDDVFATLMKQ